MKMEINSADKKRKIVLENFSNPQKQVDYQKLKEIGEQWKIKPFIFRNSEGNCGDVLYLIARIKEGRISEIYFSGQKACLVTISFSNIICSYLEGKSLEESKKIVENCENMFCGKEYFLEKYPNLILFSDIKNFSNRLSCIKLVTKGLVCSLFE
jgi:NifU-like protein involved in Fe-S cluster formation